MVMIFIRIKEFEYVDNDIFFTLLIGSSDEGGRFGLKQKLFTHQSGCLQKNLITGETRHLYSY